MRASGFMNNLLRQTGFTEDRMRGIQTRKLVPDIRLSNIIGRRFRYTRIHIVTLLRPFAPVLSD